MESIIFKKYVPNGIEQVVWNNKTGEVKIILINKTTKEETVKKVYTPNQSN